MTRTASIALFAGLALQAASQDIPAELEGFVSVDSSDAIVRIIGELNSPDADQALIEITAPAGTTVTVGEQTAIPSEADFLAPTLLDIAEGVEGDMGADIEYLADGSQILILNRDSSNITRFDAATFGPLAPIALSSLGFAFDVTPDGTTAIVANYTDDTATLVNLSTGAETVVAVGDAPGLVEVSPDGAFAVVACVSDSTFHVINLATQNVDRIINTPGYAQILSFSTEAAAVDFRITTPLLFLDNATIAFPARFDDLVTFIDITTGARTDLPLADTDPAGIDRVGDTILVGHAINPGVVTVIDANTRTVDRTIGTVGTRANGPVALNADATRAAVSLQNTTRVLNLTTDTFGPALNTSNLNDVRPNFDRTRAVGVGFSGAVIDFASGNLLARANDRVSAAFGTTSPAGDQAAMVSTTFGDDLVVIDTDAAPSLLLYDRTGPAPEGDISRNAAVSADGSIAVSSNVFSDNLSIFDTTTQNRIGLAPLDERAGEVEITPDGTTAVACNLDGFTVSIVDLATGTTTAVPSARRLSQVEISPDGQFAYLAQVASGDGIRKLDIASASFIGGLTPTGNLGGVGYSYSQNSQIALNPDGSLLAIASSFTDQLIILDTDTMSISQSFTVGAFPTRVAWSDDGTYLLVADNSDNTVHVFVDVGAGVGVYVLDGVVNTGTDPFDMLVEPGNARAFVLNWGDETLGVINLNTLQQVSAVPLPFRPMGASFNDDASEIRVAGGNATTSSGGGNFTQTREGEVTIIETATLNIVDTIDTGEPNASYAASADGTRIAYASPGADGLALIREDTCPPDTNFDGILSPADFNGWIIQFNTQGPKCDQNGDNACTPADFNAWILNFNAGC